MQCWVDLRHCSCVCVQHKRRRIKSVSDDEEDEHVADMEMIGNEIFGDDDDAGSVAPADGAAVVPPTDFNLEQSDEESGSLLLLMMIMMAI